MLSVKLCLWTENFLKIPDQSERDIQIPLQITPDPKNASALGKVNAPIGVPSSAAGTTQGPGQNTRKEEEPGVSSREASPTERDEGRICNDDFFYRHLNQYHMSNCGCRCMFVDHFNFLYK